MHVHIRSLEHNIIPTNHTDSVDYNAVSNIEIVFIPGQTVGDVQCISIAILDDDNVLEYSEFFQMSVTSSSSFVIVPSEQDTVDIYIDEDPQDGKIMAYIYRHLF